MISWHVTSPPLFKSENLRDLLRSTGPCVTIVLPPYRPGGQEQPMAAKLKSMLPDLQEKLIARHVPEDVTRDLMEPLSDLKDDEDLLSGSQFGLIILRSPERFEHFDLRSSAQPLCVIGSYFQIRPILSAIHLPPEVYLLELSRKQVKLFKCVDHQARRVPLPRVPETFDEALAFEKPDHNLENRSSAGASVGTTRVRFGTGSERETQHAHLADFYRMVDRAIMELLHGSDVPLVLAGVDEDTAAYRSIHTYANVIDQTIHGSAEKLSERALAEQAYALVRSSQIDWATAAAREWKERLAPARYTTDLQRILNAAIDGRVDKLFIGATSRAAAAFPLAAKTGRWSQGDEDLLNAAAVETILHDGRVFELPSDKMPDQADIAATFRY